jgi:FMN phosphatase YigB (HAD superfamily)
VGHRLWVFDVDGCLIDSLSGTALRPGAAELLAELGERGCEVHLWSAGGADYARQRARAHGIDRLVRCFHDKAERDGDGRYVPHAITTDLAEAVFVDDRPEDLPIGATVLAVFPYLAENPHDRALWKLDRDR